MNEARSRTGRPLPTLTRLLQGRDLAEDPREAVAAVDRNTYTDPATTDADTFVEESERTVFGDATAEHVEIGTREGAQGVLLPSGEVVQMFVAYL